MPRLLAYGGTAWEYRATIGSWPGLDSAIFGDATGLAPTPAVGHAVSSVGHFLIVQYLHDTGTRQYPYTLLLDPGENVWRRFGYNGAAVLLEVLRSSLASALLEHPDTVSELQFEAMFDRLEPSTPASFAQDDFAATWMDAVLSETAVVVDRRLPPGTLALPALADRLCTFPEPFRAGRGWSAGLTPTIVSAFGITAIVGGTLPPPPSGDGHALLRGWTHLLASGSSSLVQQHNALPFGQWPPGNEAKELLGDTIALGWLLAGRVESAVVYISGNSLARRTILPALTSAADTALWGDEPLSPSASRYVLQRLEENALTAPDSWARRLDAETVAEWFTARSLRLADWRFASLPSTTRMAVSRKAADRARGEHELRTVIEDAWAETADVPLLRDLLAFWARSQGPMVSFFVSGVPSGDAEQAAFAALRLQPRANAHAVDIVAFGGPWLGLEQIAGREDEIVRAAVELSRASRWIGRASEFLEWAGHQGFRTKLTAETALAAAGTGAASWSRLAAVARLLSGRRDASPARGETPLAAHEIDALCERHRASGTTPDLAGLAETGWPELQAVVERLRSYEPPLNNAASIEWLRGWLNLADTEKVSAELQRAMRSKAVPVALVGQMLRVLPENHLAASARMMLFDLDETFDSRARDLASALPATQLAPPSISQIHVFIRRFGWDLYRLNEAFKAMGDEAASRILAHFVLESPARTAAEAVAFLQMARSIGPSPHAFPRILVTTVGRDPHLKHLVLHWLGTYDPETPVGERSEGRALVSDGPPSAPMVRSPGIRARMLAILAPGDHQVLSRTAALLARGDQPRFAERCALAVVGQRTDLQMRLRLALNTELAHRLDAYLRQAL